MIGIPPSTPEEGSVNQSSLISAPMKANIHPLIASTKARFGPWKTMKLAENYEVKE